MANLSNINGKFVVEQTTGYVGVGTTDPNYPIEVLNSSAEIALNASGASIYRLRSDSTDSFRINKNGVGDRFVIQGDGKIQVNSDKVIWAGGYGGGLVIRQNNATGDRLIKMVTVDSTGAIALDNVLVAKGSSVGIGTANPSSKFQVEGAPANGTYLSYLYNSATHNSAHGLNVQTTTNNILTYGLRVNTGGDSNALAVMGNGTVGIGTASPDAKLEVAGGSTGIRLSNVGDSGAYDSVEMTYSGYNSGTPEMKFRPTQTPGSGIVNSYFRFINSNGSSTTSNNNANVTIDGNVGIGTDSPSYRLDINSSDAGLRIVGTTRSQILLSNSTSAWQIESPTSSGNVPAGALGIIESGVGSRLTILTGGNVGLGNTIPYSRLDLNGVLSIGSAELDPSFTVTSSGLSTIAGGSLEIVQGFGGTSSAGDTIVFTYEAQSWKAFQYEYCISAAYGLSKGGGGGYNNNGMSSYYYVTTNQGSNVNVTSVTSNSGGSNNQYVIVTITGNFGIHPCVSFKYAQSGGDGAPRADRATLAFNS